MYFWGALLLAVVIGFWWVLPFRGTKRAIQDGDKKQEKLPSRDLNANINPSQSGNEADLWPDRTGARTRDELGAKRAVDMAFVGDRAEAKGHTPPDSGQELPPGPLL